jgi:polyisoprenoid-binding protein YceI
MKKLAIILSAFIFLNAFTSAPGVWKNDDPHSQLGFTVTHLGINDVSGTFNDFDVTVTSAKADFSDAVIQLSAKTASIETRVEARNNHLKSADFFDAAKFPELNFKSTSLKRSGKNKFKLTGDLSIHGITKVVTMDLLYKGQVVNPMSKKLTNAFQVTGTINRSDFNLGSSFPAAVISNEVRIKADGEFVSE